RARPTAVGWHLRSGTIGGAAPWQPAPKSPSFLTVLLHLLRTAGVAGVVWDQWWTYDGISGMAYWGVFNPDWSMCHDGRRQSPINVEPESLLFDPHLRYVHIDKATVSGHLKNSGHGVVFNISQEHRGRVNITGASLSYSYQLEEAHIHFGMKNTDGSEHQISGRAFPAEIQLVGFNANLYNNLTVASSKNHGIVVVSILVQHGTTPNDQLLRFTEASRSIPFRNDAVQLANITISGLLPQTEFYLTYEGSLTWPACFESVTWILMNKPIYITVQQLEQLRRLSQSLASDATKSPLGDNYRRPQPLYHRPVRTNIDFTGAEDGACPTMYQNKHYAANRWLGT
ncbi:carbonic anhydrase-related protein 10-like, partial [Pollicipes pollicipes]|uniref:carbonic anhydrase-related protein 10-like n=1 Tax=Pollicipes pollicipes TaxID=41117 RepID=UPI0018851F17